MQRMVDSAEGGGLATRRRCASRARRIRHVLIHVFEAMGLVALVAVALVALRLSSGPIYLGWLHDRIASSLEQRAGSRYGVELGPTYVMHDSWGVGLGFRKLTLRDREGRAVLSAPRGRIDLDPFGAILGDVKIRRLELDDLGLWLKVAADGSLSIAASGDQSTAPIALPGRTSGLDSPNLAVLIRSGAEAMAGASQAIDRLTLANARFEIDNEATNRSVTYKDFNLAFDHSGDAAHARITAVGPAGPWTIEADATVGEAPTLAVKAHDVSLADLETFDKKPPPVFAEGPIAFRFESRLAPDGAIQTLSGRFTMGAGQARINNPDALPFLMDEASGRIEWEGGQKRLRVDDFLVLSGETRVAASGWVAPPSDPAGAWTARLQAKNARFAPERRGEKPVALDVIDAEARFLPLQSRFIIDNLSAKGPTFDGGLKGEVAPDGAGASLKLDLRLRPSVTQDVMRLWPQFINPDVRDWAAHNLHGGQIEGTMIANWSAADLDAMDHKRAVARDSVRGSFLAHDVAVDLLPGLPPLTTSAGSGSFTGRDFAMSADHASMELSPTRRIQAENLAFTIPDTSPRAIVDAEARAHLIGTADALADLLSREPLRKQAGLQIDPATVKGQAEGDLMLALKLGKTAKPEDSQFHATGALTNLTLDKFIGSEKLDQATFSFVADRNTLSMTGEGQLFGATADLEAGRGTGDEGSATLTVTLDQAARAKRGLNFGWLTGPLPITLKAPLSRASAEVEIDLSQAGVDNPVPGVAKAAGKPGKASFEIKPSPGGATLSNLAVDFGAVSLRGTAEIGVDGAIQDAKFAQARISPGDNFQVDVVNTAAGLKATVRGATLDARPFLRSLNEQASSAQTGAKDFDIDMKIGAAIGANRQSISGLELNLTRRDGEDRLVSLKGRLGQGAIVANRDDGGGIRLTAGDAGALARFADLYTRMDGGALDLALRTERNWSAGLATVTNFALRDEPAFRQLVAAAPADTPGRAVDPTLAHFQKMTVAFERSPGELDIKDAVIYNHLVGITTSGVVDFASGAIDVGGTFVPAYSLNSLLNKIPLVGTLLGGGQNEGVFGITYRAEGPLANPKLTVNPLSAIAPGILRKILGVMDGTAGRGGFTPGEAAAAPTPVPAPATGR
jgi:hypothetical protein